MHTAMEEISSLKRSVESMGLSIHKASATGKAALKGTWDELGTSSSSQRKPR